MPYLLDSPRKELRKRPLLFLDFEMTGLNHEVHEIIEIAALCVNQDNFQIDNSYYAKIRPEHIETADPRCLRVTDYTPQKWNDAIPLRQALLELTDFAPGCLLVGWGVQNEWDFLNAALQKEKLSYFYDHHLIEVGSIAYAHFYNRPEVKYLSLSYVSRYLNIPLENHKPDSDIRATYKIFCHLLGIAQ